jgi:soluble lytic murein transglycosylase
VVVHATERRFGVAIAVVSLMACGRTQATPASGPDHAPGAARGVSSAAPAPSPTAAPAPAAPGDGSNPAAAPWPALVGDERWNAAWRALEALPDAEKSRPEVRYVRARVALAREDPTAALPLLDGLEVALPLLAEDVARWRALAELAVGPFEEAGEWWAARPAPAAQLDAARAFEKAKDVRRARAAADRVLSNNKRTRSQEAEARALRIRIAESPGEPERADARWLATYGADVGPADSLASVTRLYPGHPLTAQELLLRVRALSDAGRTDDALRAIDLVAGAPGADKVSDLDRMRARGTTLFHARGRWSEAAKTLAECAGAGGPHAAEDAFHAARALSRADRDEEAIRGYEDVERRFPKSNWADDAAFFVPYLRMLHAEWQGCASGFDEYLRSHPTGEHGRDARRDGGLCKLYAGDARGARSAFERLSEDLGADPIGSARMANLAALAAARDGDRTHAVALWTDVMRQHPLSWPALVAQARLAEVGAPAPPAIDRPQAPSAGPPPLAVALPPPADLLHGLGLDADAEAALRDRESAVASGAGSRVPEALCASYGVLGRARRRYQIAQTLPSSLFTIGPDARTRWAWDCAFPSPYTGDVRAAEAEEALPAGLIWSVMRQESGFDPDVVSPARAVGLMQVLPETARLVADEFSMDPDDARLTSPPFNVRVGAHFMHKLLERFHGDIPLAIAAYNGGADSIERWLSRAPGMQLDTFIERIPYDETRDYVVRVMGNLAHYGYLARGEEGVPRIDLDLRTK